MITGYTSIYTLIDKLYRDLGVNYELNELDIVSWTAEALGMIGAYSQYNEISECLNLVNGKAKLPCGFHKLVDINYKGKPVYWATNTNANNYQCNNCSIPSCHNGNCDLTFYINNSYLISNINNKNNEEANICIVYLGIPTDDDGYPMIPDDVYYMKACYSYIVSILDYQEWRKGKLPDKVKEESKADWLFYVNSARGAANMPNTQQMENMAAIFKRLLPSSNEYAKGWKNFTKRERLNLLP